MRARNLCIVLTLVLNGCAWSYPDHFFAKPHDTAGAGTATYQLAKEQLAQGYYGLAEFNFTQIVENDPGSINALNGLAIAEAKLGHGDRALNTFEEALALDPKSPITLTNLAYFNLRKGDPQAAVLYGRRATSALEGQGASKAKLSHVMLAAIEGNFAHAQRLVSAYADNAQQAVPAPRLRQEEASSRIRPTYRVSNGVGIQNLAQRTANFLKRRGVNVSILSNERRFDQRKTVIYYNPGLASYAKKVAQMMPMHPRLIVARAGRGQVEVILGADVRAYSDQIIRGPKNA